METDNNEQATKYSNIQSDVTRDQGMPIAARTVRRDPKIGRERPGRCLMNCHIKMFPNGLTSCNDMRWMSHNGTEVLSRQTMYRFRSQAYILRYHNKIEGRYQRPDNGRYNDHTCIYKCIDKHAQVAVW